MEELKISLAAARKNANMTQEDVAEKMHISKQTLLNWEKGYSEPSVTQFTNLSELYGIPERNIFLPEKSEKI